MLSRTTNHNENTMATIQRLTTIKMRRVSLALSGVGLVWLLSYSLVAYTDVLATVPLEVILNSLFLSVSGLIVVLGIGYLLTAVARRSLEQKLERTLNSQETPASSSPLVGAASTAEPAFYLRRITDTILAEIEQLQTALPAATAQSDATDIRAMVTTIQSEMRDLDATLGEIGIPDRQALAEIEQVLNSWRSTDIWQRYDTTDTGLPKEVITRLSTLADRRVDLERARSYVVVIYLRRELARLIMRLLGIGSVLGLVWYGSTQRPELTSRFGEAFMQSPTVVATLVGLFSFPQLLFLSHLIRWLALLRPAEQ